MTVFLNDLDKFAAGVGRYSITHDAEKTRPIWRAHLIFLFKDNPEYGDRLQRVRDMSTRFRRSAALEDHGGCVTITLVPTLQ